MTTNNTLCVLRDGQQDQWSVWICVGFDERRRLAGFNNRAEAADFALAEAARRAEEGLELTVHLPDDCPCYPEHERLMQVNAEKP